MDEILKFNVTEAIADAEERGVPYDEIIAVLQQAIESARINKERLQELRGDVE